MDGEYDVVVVGAGGSGLAAAVSCAENGLSVIVLEKGPACGGTTGIAVGSFTACMTRLQKSKGIDDNLQSHLEDAAKFAPAEIEQCNHSLLRQQFLSEAATTLDWLVGMGIRFQGPNAEPPNSRPRMHNVVPRAKVYISTLRKRLIQLGGCIRCNAKVTQLVQQGTAVRGVEVSLPEGSRTFQARRGVVLAAGDYANSSELIAEYKGTGFAEIDGINQDATGDGHRLARAAGASLVNMNITYGPEIRFVPAARPGWIERLPTEGWSAQLLGRLARFIPRAWEQKIAQRILVTWQHPEDSLFADGALLLNKEGRRFCDERRSPEREMSVSRQTDKQCYILLDGDLTTKYSHWPHFISTAPQIAYAYVQDYVRLRKDITFRGETLPMVARRSGLPAAAVQATIDSLNRDAAQCDGAANRDAANRERKGPWVILGPAKSYFTTTEGGAAIDSEMRVLDRLGAPITGLYAVGQNGLGGQILWGHGLHIAWAITSGRLVGRSLARKSL